jgi:hypothetical protein
MTSTIIRRAMRTALAACISALLLAGCNSVPPPRQRADYSTALNKYYEGRPMCLWPDAVKFPVENASRDEIEALGFDALTDAGLLLRKHAGKDASRGSYTYDLSPEGRSAIDPDIFNPGAGNFCYGRRKVIGIDSDRRNTSATDLIEYRYSVAQPASWATEDTIQRAFPQVAGELSGPHKAEVTLLDTTDGWEVSGAPNTMRPLLTPPRATVVAKAKALLHPRKKQSS